MQRVLYVVDKIEGGGATRVIIRLADMLSDSYAPILTSMVESHGYSNYDLEGIKVIPSDVSVSGNPFQKFFRVMKNIVSLVEIIKENKVDCVLAFLERSNACSIVAAKITGVKVIVSVRNNVDRQYSSVGFIGKVAIKAGLSILYRRADHLVSLSKGVESQLVRDLNLNSFSVSTIYNPYFIDLYKRSSKVERVQGESAYFLAVGRLEYQKGFDHLIKCFSYYRRYGGKRKLLILGEGGLREYLEELVQFYDAEGTVQLLGYKPNAIEYMHRADCFVFSSRWEGFGNALVEAILCGLPVISSDCDFGPSEIIGCVSGMYPRKSPLGVLVEPFCDKFNKNVGCNPQEAQFVEAMLDFDPSKYKRSDFSRRGQEFSSVQVFDQWHDLLGSVISGRKNYCSS